MSWPVAKLGDLVSHVSSGATPKGGSENYSNSGPVMFLRSQNIHMNELRLDDVIYINEDTHKKMKRSVVQYGDVLLNITGASIGRVAPFELKGAEVNSNQHVCTIRPFPKVLDYKYLSYFLGNSKFQEGIFSSQRGGTREALNYSQIRDFEIPLPPLEEQKRIAAILDKADAIRRKRQHAIKLADDFLRSVFLDMFGDPVANPKGWEVKKLGEVAELINGDRSSNYPSGDDLKESGILFLNTKNITDDKIELVDPVFITEEKFNSLSRGKLQREDLVITLRGTLGSCAIFNTEYETGFINAQLMIIRPKVGITSDFLHAYLTSGQIHDVLQSLGRGAAVPQLTGAQMKDLDVYIPNVELLYKFTKIKNTVSNVKFKCNVAEKAELFESLSKKAFSGQI